MIKLSFKRGFTLFEVLFTAAILAFCLSGILATYINMLFLGDLSRDFTLVTNTMQAKLEEIKKANFDSLSSLNGSAFNINGFTNLNAIGVVEVTDTTYSDLKKVRIVVCFKSRGRLIGEDKNLNGILDQDQGEDTNGNSRLDSSAELVTLIAR